MTFSIFSSNHSSSHSDTQSDKTRSTVAQHSSFSNDNHLSPHKHKNVFGMFKNAEKSESTISSSQCAHVKHSKLSGSTQDQCSYKERVNKSTNPSQVLGKDQIPEKQIEEKEKSNTNNHTQRKFPMLLRRCSNGMLQGCDICLFG